MHDLLHQAKDFFVNNQTAGNSLIAIIVIWVLGKLSSSAWYRAVRAGWGKICAKAGEFVDATLGSRLGRPIWDPLEKVFVDLLGFAAEQFCAGLRRNDVEAMADQHERLVDVGSKNRAAMVKDQLVLALEAKRTAEAPEQPPPSP